MSRAYEVLSDPEQRARYDRFGEAGVGGSGGGPNIDDIFSGGLDDLFSSLFGRRRVRRRWSTRTERSAARPGHGGRRHRSRSSRRCSASTVPVTLRLPQRCADCDGTGAGAGTKPVTCVECNGSGQVQRVRQSLLGQMVTTSPCPRCGGLGQVVVTPCPTCRGEGRVTVEHTYQVDVPAGVDNGSTLRLTGRGAAGPRGGANGDLYVHLRVDAHERYLRDGDDLVTAVPISIAQAALGTTVTLPTLDGDEEIARAGRHAARHGVRAAPARRAAAAGPRPRRPARRARRRGADEAHRRRGSTCSASSPSCAASRSARPTRACSRGSSRRSSSGRMDEALRRSAAHVLVDDVASPTLDEPTRHHLVRVLRLRDGGAGHRHRRPRRVACVHAARRRLEVDEAPVATARRDPPLTIVVAPPKGDRLDWLVAKCTEVGIDRIVLVDADAVGRALAGRAARAPARPAASHRRGGGDAVTAGVAAGDRAGRSPAVDGARRPSWPSPAGGR